jgi:hypothetical protein
MDGRRLNAFAGWLSGGSSRRAAIGLGLAGLLAPLGHGDATAKNKKHHNPVKRCGNCAECHHCVKGRCRAVTNGSHCSNGGICEAGACVSFAFCPPGCPTCSACTSATSLCEAQPNGQPGNQCESPQVCCNGSCCEVIHECNSDGNCATCEEACPRGCDLCLTLSDGSKVCGGRRSHCTGGGSCTDCPVDVPFTPACVTSVTDRATNTTTQGCGVPVGTGTCWDIEPCTECVRACPTAACLKCLNLAEGGIQCSGSGATCNSTPCSTNASCSEEGPGAVCANSVFDRNTNTTTQECGGTVGTGRCWIPTNCNIV